MSTTNWTKLLSVGVTMLAISSLSNYQLYATAGPPMPQSVAGLRITLQSAERLPNGHIKITYSVNSLGNLKKGAKVSLGDVEFCSKGRGIPHGIVVWKTWKQGQQRAQATIETELSREITAASVRQEVLVVDKATKPIRYTFSNVTPLSKPVTRKAWGHTVTLLKAYVNDYLVSGNVKRLPASKYVKQQIDFCPGTSGRKSNGILVESDYSDYDIGKMKACLRSNDEKVYPLEGYIGLVDKEGESARIFLFKADGRRSQIFTFELTHELRPVPQRTWVTFDNIAVRPSS